MDIERTIQELEQAANILLVRKLFFPTKLFSIL